MSKREKCIRLATPLIKVQNTFRSIGKLSTAVIVREAS